MTVVIDSQVKAIVAEIEQQSQFATHKALWLNDFGAEESLAEFKAGVNIEDVVRFVIASYDISEIARSESDPE